MPTYSYRCTECDHVFDIQQSFTDDSLSVCPECGGRLRKVFNNIAVTFNGSGFYRTDSRAQAGGGRPGSGDPAKSSVSGGSGSDSSASGGSSGGDSSATSAKEKPSVTKRPEKSAASGSASSTGSGASTTAGSGGHKSSGTGSPNKGSRKTA